MDTTDLNNDKLEVTEKFETSIKYKEMNYMEDIIQSAYNENDISLLMSSSAQMSQDKKYLVRKTAGVQKRKNNTFVPTVPKPFTFHTASRVNISRNEDSSPRSPFIPLAVKVRQFMEKPEKFNTKAALKSNKVRSNTLTVPRSPYLRTKYRSKPTVLSTEERVIKEIQDYRFRANPVDQKIFENGDIGIPKVQKPKPTEPHSPTITKPKPSRPKSPSPPRVIKANPVPDYKEPYRPVVEHRLIDLPDFSLPGEEISKRKSQEIEERIRREREELERMREFRAQPLPTDSPDCLPIRHYYAPTHPKEFTLLTDSRGEIYQKEFYERLRKEREREKENQFYAQPLPSFEPEVLKKPECPPPTEPISFSFLTDTRMKERHLYDEQRRLRDKEAEEQKEQKLREEEARQTEEIRRLRVELIHHAQPIRHYSPIVIQPSNKRPTRPVSPMIGEKRRKYIQILNNHDYSFGDSIFDLGNMDSVDSMSNIESLDQILYSSFEIGQTTTNSNAFILAPIAESETEFQDIIMTDTANSKQVQEEDLIMNEVTSMTDEIDLNKMQN